MNSMFLQPQPPSMIKLMNNLSIFYDNHCNLILHANALRGRMRPEQQQRYHIVWTPVQ
jgi:hypothetical protein